MGKSTISMAIFNSYVSHNQRVHPKSGFTMIYTQNQRVKLMKSSIKTASNIKQCCCEPPKTDFPASTFLGGLSAQGAAGAVGAQWPGRGTCQDRQTGRLAAGCWRSVQQVLDVVSFLGEVSLTFFSYYVYCSRIGYTPNVYSNSRVFC